MKPLRTAILGCGGFAHMHAKNLLMLPDEITLVACCDVVEASARQFSEQYSQGQATVYMDHNQMFNQQDLDLVLICLPPYGHSNEVELASNCGVHILIEKPIALTSEHAWKMVSAAEQAGIKTQVGFKFRFGEAIENLKKLITSGDTGRIGLMSARYFCNALHAPWWRSREKSGGQLVEQVIHMVDLMRYLLGEATTVYSRMDNLFHQGVPDYTVEDISATIFGFESGALGVIYASNGAIPGKWINDYRLVAQNITAEFTDSNHANFYMTSGKEVHMRLVAAEKDLLLAELRDLLDAIRTDGNTRTPIREGAKSLDLALAASRSAESRSEIQLS